MRLSDIDEDDSATESPRSALVIAQGPPPASPAGALTAPAMVTVADSCTKKSHQNHTCRDGSVLDDLFGSIGVNVPPSSLGGCALSVSSAPAAPVTQKTTPTAAAATSSDVLNDLFASPTLSSASKSAIPTKAGETYARIYVDGNGGGVDDGVTNLLDLSKPTKKERYNNAESFLEAFERQGKKIGSAGGCTDKSETLADLTRNKDDNKVRARLLALMNYYDVLGVAPTASEEEIRRSYKKKALELHPDRVGRDQTQEEAELFKVITKANEVLSDAEKRRVYDAALATGAGQPAVSSSATDWWTHVQI
ncbi:hypothetical protein JKF63_00057 [Porcisia hertigi]|uniref:J domain-containing protein n=1 Tax=Porcisia hertigi TaxID=2761500 RepID=A0A836HEE0_9TRYP|nr:hypothetical protein JKF63_00057 [Porcisia hertigi]